MKGLRLGDGKTFNSRRKCVSVIFRNLTKRQRNSKEENLPDLFPNDLRKRRHQFSAQKLYSLRYNDDFYIEAIFNIQLLVVQELSLLDKVVWFISTATLLIEDASL